MISAYFNHINAILEHNRINFDLIFIRLVSHRIFVLGNCCTNVPPRVAIFSSQRECEIKEIYVCFIFPYFCDKIGAKTS